MGSGGRRLPRGHPGPPGSGQERSPRRGRLGGCVAATSLRGILQKQGRVVGTARSRRGHITQFPLEFSPGNWGQAWGAPGRHPIEKKLGIFSSAPAPSSVSPRQGACVTRLWASLRPSSRLWVQGRLRHRAAPSLPRRNPFSLKCRSRCGKSLSDPRTPISSQRRRAPPHPLAPPGLLCPPLAGPP